MTTPFDTKLPPKWTALLIGHQPSNRTLDPIYQITNEKGEIIAHALVDATIPLSAHIQYCWRRYYAGQGC